MKQRSAGPAPQYESTLQVHYKHGLFTVMSILQAQRTHKI